MKTHLVQIFSILVLAIFCIETYAQNEDYDEEHIESSLANFSGLSLSTEYYRFSENETAWYFVANGKIEFGDSDYLNLELI